MYVKETMPKKGEVSTGETRFCFKPSSTYTAQCHQTRDSSIVIDTTGTVMDSPESPGSSHK